MVTPGNPNIPHEIDTTNEDVWQCRDGRPHQWLYRRDALAYFCPGCKGTILKSNLKRATDRVGA